MARKSSKTAHVMNLLAGGETESSKSEAAKENLAASQAAESKGTIKELTVLAQQASIQMQDSPLSPSPISIIDLSSSVQDPVAELIKQQLEEDEKREAQTDLPEEMENFATADSATHSLADTIEYHVDDSFVTNNEELPIAEQIVEPSDDSTDKIDEADIQEINELNDLDISDTDEQIQMGMLSTDEAIQTNLQDYDISTQPDLPDSGESSQPDLQDLDNPVQPEMQKVSESIESHMQSEDAPGHTGKPASEAPVALTAHNFKYLNVMEHVVENIARDYVGRLGGCTCEHCIADVTALTLNKLTPKYVVVEPPAASPLLNFYSSRFAPQVIVELTKSCFIVKENPHH